MQYSPDFEKWNSLTLSEIIEELLGKTFTCPKCGKIHSMNTQKIVLGEDLIDEMGEHIHSLGLSGSPLIVFDKNTYEVAGKRLLIALEKFNPQTLVFDREDLHADSNALGRVLIAMSENPSFLMSVGSGTLTDTVRYTALKTGKPFIAFGTAASMDGYASSSTPIIVDGFKTTYPGIAPLAIFGDTKIIAKAPRKMTAAGFGDILAKKVALMDWKLAADVEGEEFCSLVYDIVERGVNECVSASYKIQKGDPAACGKLMEVLALTGVGMQMMGNSRPASGAEHHISHLLEMKDIMRGNSGSLHGDKVGIGTLISLYIYRELFKDGLPDQKETLGKTDWENEIIRVYGDLSEEAIKRNESTPPKGEKWQKQQKRLAVSMEKYGFDFIKEIKEILPLYKSMIKDQGGPVYPNELGYSTEDIYDAIAFSKEVRPKFTILRIAERYGHLYDLADKISKGLSDESIY